MSDRLPVLTARQIIGRTLAGGCFARFPRILSLSMSSLKIQQVKPLDENLGGLKTKDIIKGSKQDSNFVKQS